LDAAQLVYDGFWGKDLNVLLQDVPGHGNLQYLLMEVLPPARGTCTMADTADSLSPSWGDVADSLSVRGADGGSVRTYHDWPWGPATSGPD